MTDLDAERAVLTSEIGSRLLVEASLLESPTPADLSRLCRLAPRELVSAALRLSKARRKGRSKFERADLMWLDPTGVEQATSDVVARYKAARFSSADLVIDLCSGVGGDALAIAAHARVIAADSDSARLRRLAWNAEVLGVADRVLPVRSLAEAFPIPRDAFVHVDPDRRAEGPRRALTLDDYQPDIDFLRELTSRVRGGGVKLGPASDFHRIERGRTEVEVISVRGECKEATVWFGEFARTRRRAAVLPEGAYWTGDPLLSAGTPPTKPLSDYILEPDPSLTRSGLLESFASAHDLAGFAPRTDLRTASDPIASPFLTCYRVRRAAPLDIKTLRRMLDEERIGVLDVKTRRLHRRPEAIRRELKLQGDRAATLFLLGGDRRERSLAILADRLSRALNVDFSANDSFGKSDKV